MKTANHFMKVSLFLLAIKLLTTASYASTSHFYLTNNTSKPLVVKTLADKANTLQENRDWQSVTTTIPAYEQRQVFSINRNNNIKANSKNHFKLVINKNITHQITVTGRKIYGSRINIELLLPNQARQTVMQNHGIERYETALTLNDHKLELYERNWLPLGQLHDDFHVVLHEVLPEPAPSTANNQLKVLSYNVKLLPIYAQIETPMNKPYRRAKNIPQYIKNYDVVVLQEVTDRLYRETVLNALQDAYPYRSKVVGMDSKKPVSGGVVILSRWPIIAEDEMVFNACGGWDCQSAKGVVHATIDKAGKLYHIFGTHLQAGHFDEKVQQVHQFSDFIQQQKIPLDEPVLLAGDFNLRDSSAKNRQLIEKVLGATLMPLSGFPFSFDFSNTMAEENSQSRIDYFIPLTAHAKAKVMSNNIRVIRALNDEKMWNKFDLSDHYALEGYFEF